MPRLRLIQRNSKCLLLDDDARFRDIYINPLSAALASDQFLFELYPLGNVLNAKDIVKKLDPVRPGVLIFFAFAVPPIIKLPCSLSLLCVGHATPPASSAVLLSFSRASVALLMPVISTTCL